MPFGSPLQNIEAFERRDLAADQAEHLTLVLYKTQRSEIAGALGVVGACGSVQNLSHISSGDGFGLHELRLIERPHVHVALGGPCGADDIAKSCGRQIDA